MHKRNLATMWFPWTPTREEPQLEAAGEKPKADAQAAAQNGEEKWVMEEEKFKNTPTVHENTEEKVTRLLFGMDIKKTVL